MKKAIGPDARSCVKLAALGALSALWSLFLWTELVVARSGGSAFCGFGGRFDCNAVWSSAFASAVHAWTGLPLAGWGLVWSLVAFGLPMAALLRLPGHSPVAYRSKAIRSQLRGQLRHDRIPFSPPDQGTVITALARLGGARRQSPLRRRGKSVSQCRFATRESR